MAFFIWEYIFHNYIQINHITIKTLAIKAENQKQNLLLPLSQNPKTYVIRVVKRRDRLSVHKLPQGELYR